MVIYKVDLDYESSLFDPSYSEASKASLKMIREFEYVIFLTEKNAYSLKNFKHYDSAYLSRLKQLGFSLPAFIPESPQFKKWWSHDHHLELEKILNSKLTSAQLALQNSWGFEKGLIAENIEQVRNHLEKYPEVVNWILKDPFSFSGKGHFVFKRGEEKLNKTMILEPHYERLFDIGTTFIIDNGKIKKSFMVENFISKNGGFRGGAASYDGDKFKKYIEKKYSFSLDELESITKEIAQKYIQLGAQFNVQIDSFVYKDRGEMKLYALVEVNYRKTMGLVIQCLAQKYNASDIISWTFSNQKQAESASVIRLSPDDSHFHSYLELH